MTELTEPTFRCLTCLDTGYVARQEAYEVQGESRVRHTAFRCPDANCGRRRPHPGHSWTLRCPCWLLANSDDIRAAGKTALAKGLPVPKVLELLEMVERGTYEPRRGVFPWPIWERPAWATVPENPPPPEDGPETRGEVPNDEPPPPDDSELPLDEDEGVF